MVLPKYFLLTARKILILPKSSKLGGAIAPPAPPAGTAMTIFVVGGVNDKSKSVKEVECYDISSNRWHIIKRIDNKLFGHSLITL